MDYEDIEAPYPQIHSLTEAESSAENTNRIIIGIDVNPLIFDFNYDGHIQIGTDTQSWVLSPSEGLSLLEWLYQKRDILYRQSIGEQEQEEALPCVVCGKAVKEGPLCERCSGAICPNCCEQSVIDSYDESTGCSPEITYICLSCAGKEAERELGDWNDNYEWEDGRWKLYPIKGEPFEEEEEEEAIFICPSCHKPFPKSEADDNLFQCERCKVSFCPDCIHVSQRVVYWDASDPNACYPEETYTCMAALRQHQRQIKRHGKQSRQRLLVSPIDVLHAKSTSPSLKHSLALMRRRIAANTSTIAGAHRKDGELCNA
jgi:hypothetical protein